VPVDRVISEDRRRFLVLGLCCAIFAPRAYLAVADDGMVWSDEIFQVLEQGHRAAFGYGLVPWEFKVGARSWLLPGAMGGLMKLCAGFGVAGGAGLVVACKLLFALLAVATFYPLLRMARALGGDFALVLLGVTASVLPVSLVYDSRVLAEVASAPFLAWGAWLLLPWGMAGRTGVPRHATVDWAEGVRGPAARLLAAGLLLGLGALLRYQNGILLPVFVLLVLARSGLRPAVWLVVGVMAMLALGGLLDWVTWGRPFQSLFVYLRFNLVEGGANQWGVAKRGFYLRTMLATNGPVVLLLALGFLASLRRAWPVALLALLYLLVLSVVPHKELRFIVPVVPLFLACAAVGWSALLARLPYSYRRRKVAALALGIVMVVFLAARARQVSFRDIGQPMSAAAEGGPTSGLVWDAFGERNRLFAQAATHADLCGLAAPAMNPYWTGGYTYLHRRVPLLWSAFGRELAAANYAITGPGQALGDPRYSAIAKAGPYTLLRREGPCTRPTRGSTGYGRLTPEGVPGT
jgi:phosphatidylinositol glycan class B